MRWTTRLPQRVLLWPILLSSLCPNNSTRCPIAAGMLPRRRGRSGGNGTSGSGSRRVVRRRRRHGGLLVLLRPPWYCSVAAVIVLWSWLAASAGTNCQWWLPRVAEASSAGPRAAAASRQPGRPPSAPRRTDAASASADSNQRQPTIVSGHGSSRHPHAGSVRVATTTVTTTTTTTVRRSRGAARGIATPAGGDGTTTRVTHILAADRTNAPLYLRAASGDGSAAAAAAPLSSSGSSHLLHVYSVAHNATVALTAVPSQHQRTPPPSTATTCTTTTPAPTRPLHATVLHNHATPTRTDRSRGWIPVEGLYGVYVLPSGPVYVWIVQSTPVYTAPPVPSLAVSDSNDKNKSLVVEEEDSGVWWQIHRVTELHLTRLVSPPAAAAATATATTITMTRAQRHQEQRQLRLLRQALKDHEWYFCKSGGGIIPDLTRNLQCCLRRDTTTTAGTDESKDVEQAALDDVEAHDSVSDRQSGTTLRRWWHAAAVDGACHSGRRRHPQPRRPDSRFFWNELVVEPLVQHAARADNRTDSAAAFEILLAHVIPVTSAFCGVQRNLSIVDNDNDTNTAASTMMRYDQVLISRRSRFRAGTRFTKRGADATGAVANYAETEQVVVVWTNSKASTAPVALHAVLSHVQTRGSIPLRWSSPTDIKTYRPRIRIGTDPLAQARAVRQHLVDQGTRYIVLPNASNADDTLAAAASSVRGRSGLTRRQPPPSLLLVNLVDKTSDQGRLGRALDAVLQAVLDVYGNDANPALPWLKSTYIEHLWFDFHAEVKSGRWDRLVGLLEQVKPALMKHDYFMAVPTVPSASSSANLFRVERLQTGVVRTNCMDCLDRTNVVQSIFGRYMLFQQLADFQSVSCVPLPFKTAFRRAPMVLPWSAGEVAHRLLWADNADAISRLYAGTAALKGDFTRTGKRTKKGALDDGLNSLQRYYLNNFLDADRQEGVDLLTGHEAFSNVDERDDDTTENDTSAISSRRSGMSVQEAARRMLLGAFDDRETDATDGDHVRIKLRRTGDRRPSPPAGGPRRSLDLRWLPGDLQSQVRDTITFADAPDDFQSREFLHDMEHRAASDAPWWVVADSSASESDSGSTFTAVYEAETTAAGNNPGYLLGAFVAGTQAPLAMAAVVMGLAAASFSFSIAEAAKEASASLPFALAAV